MKKLCTLLAIMTFIAIQSFGQSITFDDIRSIRLRNSGAILDNNEVKGYYLFYETDKVDRKNRAYELTILDQNLNKVATKKIVDSKYLILQAASYNGQTIMLKFFNVKDKIVSFEAFDREAKLAKKHSRELEKNEELTNYYLGTDDKGLHNGSSFYAAGQDGFVNYTVRAKALKMGYKIEYIPSSDNGKKWSFETDLEEKGVRVASFMYADESVILSTLVERPKAMSLDDNVTSVEALDTKTGKQVWKTAIASSIYELGIVNNYIDKKTGDITLFGTYFKKGDNPSTDKSLGLFSKTLDKTGKEKSENYISWVEHVGKFLPVSDKGKIEDVGYIFFHTFVKTDDGKIFAVGEQYRKAISAGAVALNVLSGGSNISNTKLVIEDFYIFEFSSEFALNDVKVFEKGKSNIMLPAGATFMSPAAIANYMMFYGSFDYSFLQQTNEGDVFHIGYQDYDREAEKGQRAYFGAITYADGEFSTDKLPINNKSSNINLSPAKTGFVLVMEHFVKEKKLELRLEKINF